MVGTRKRIGSVELIILVYFIEVKEGAIANCESDLVVAVWTFVIDGMVRWQSNGSLGCCPLNLLFYLLVAQVTSLHIRWTTIHTQRSKIQKIENQPVCPFV